LPKKSNKKKKEKKTDGSGNLSVRNILEMIKEHTKLNLFGNKNEIISGA
jgi:hypothetical protein